MRYFLGVLILVFSAKVNAQDSLAVQMDTVKAHSWKKACLFSAIVPGSGQIYNHIAMPKGKKKAYWKVPLIYAGLGMTTYFAINNNRLKNEYKAEYEHRKVGNSPLKFTQYDNQSLLSLYTTHRSRRDFAILGIGAVYLLNILDAGIEAHFVNFDISDDLSMSIHPTAYTPNSYGISFRFKFR
ncbi:DUF5683 domain-containing protein [Fluviicola sp.]|jgi:hypothetical protein|uniref:DUF5683 domain-containing protein n=1 Tax=Fluviicola sp. TaxID=1917219 RepID=UPI002837E5A7|nr:DUF5683 domain-containing protein [Fluviicola sp.]MDR0801982.1 DUF5683 domain-containing protein [Fluviicola sp.]